MTRLYTRGFGPLKGILASLPAFRGKHLMIDVAAKVARRLRGDVQEIQLWPGARFSVDLRDRVQRQMWFASYEPHVTRALSAVLRPGDTFLDVGAHIGYHSVFAAGIVGSEGRVLAFEPDPKVHARLANNLAPFVNARALRYAVSDSQAQMMFERSWDSQESGWGALTSVRDFQKGEHIAVQTVSLDHWCKESDTKAIRAVKIDAEGSEGVVLRGAQRLLRSLRPVLCIEFNEVLLKQGGENGQALMDMLSANQYSVHELSLRGLRRLTEAPEEFAECLCIPEESFGEVLQLLRNSGFRN